MPFTDSCRNIRLQGSTLSAECRTSDSSAYKLSSVSLDSLLGNIDGEFRWGLRDFSKSAQNITLKNAHLSAELKTPKGKWVLATVDLNTNIHNKNGVLEGVNITPVKTTPDTPAKTTPDTPTKATPDTPAKATPDTPAKAAPGPVVTEPSSSLKVDITKVNGASAASALSSSVSGVLTASSEKTAYFEETKSSTVTKHTEEYTRETRSSTSRRTMTMSFTESCRKFELRGTILHAECMLADGVTWKVSTIDLNRHIGNINGVLSWDSTDFSKTCQKIHLEGTTLIADCLISGSLKEYRTSSINLAVKLRNDNGVFVVIAYDEKFSIMLSEVPWMKFRVVAEPDFSIIATHPVMKKTMTHIAHSTVEHVTSQMTSILTLAIQEAVKVVTISAMEHISQSLEVMVQGVSGAAHIETSTSAAGHLHTMSRGGAEISAPGPKEVKVITY